MARVVAGALLLAQATDVADSGAAVVEVAASERYRASRVHRFTFGGGYRDLWETRVRLPELDLAVEGGGLTPTRRFGGLQTAVLGFQGRDGHSYTFRGTDKNPSAVLDPELRDTVVRSIVQDQMAAQHPAGGQVAAVISEAAGLLTIHERMVVMPDDPALGPFRLEFAGMVGSFYEYPQPANAERAGFRGATAIIDHEDLYRRLEVSHDARVDTAEFLRARLVDVLVGDFDRHRKQWRWAQFPGSSLWRPIPEDRDMAFVRYEGVLPAVARFYVPILQSYGPTVPWLEGLTLHGWEQDRWLLASVGWAQWEEIARDIQARIDDDTIERAIAALPEAYASLDGERLRRDLRGRRDHLLEIAREFYEHLAGEVDVRATDGPERFVLRDTPDGGLRVEVFDLERPLWAPPVFARDFRADETSEVRLYLRGGDDEVDADAEAGIEVEVISTHGRDVVDDTAGAGLRVLDENEELQVLGGARTDVDDKAYRPPPSDGGFVDVEGVPPRDWGSDTTPLVQFGFERDVGAFIGAGFVHTRYGFRRHPFGSRHRVTLGWATDAEELRVGYHGQLRPENSDLVYRLDLEYSGIEVLRFYGLGNETSDAGPDRFFRVRNQTVRASPSLLVPFLDGLVRMKAGPYLLWSRTKPGERLIDDLRPYGAGRFGSLGFLWNLQVDTRETVERGNPKLQLPFHVNAAAGYPTSGFLLDISAEVSPELWDVDETWGTIYGSASAYFSAGEGDRVTLALRVGGQETFGQVPYYAAAYIGGGQFFSGNTTARGFRSRRFGGDSSVYGNVDVRVYLGRVKLIVPGDVGVMGFFDIGRVFVDGESSNDWHPSGGGGLWFSPLVRSNTISLSVAASEEEILPYLRVGFHY